MQIVFWMKLYPIYSFILVCNSNYQSIRPSNRSKFVSDLINPITIREQYFLLITPPCKQSCLRIHLDIVRPISSYFQGTYTTTRRII